MTESTYWDDQTAALQAGLKLKQAVLVSTAESHRTAISGHAVVSELASRSRQLYLLHLWRGLHKCALVV